MRLLIMGPPGAGKGTQSSLLSRHLKVPAVSTGDIFRANVSGATTLGSEAKAYVDAGEYVPDDITNRMVRERLGRPDVSVGFLLDGYPRTLAQVDELETMLQSTGSQLDRVISLVVDHEVVVDRLLQRAQVEGRSDDTAEVISRRQNVYSEQTAPVLAAYRAHGIVVEVEGQHDADLVAARIITHLT